MHAKTSSPRRSPSSGFKVASILLLAATLATWRSVSAHSIAGAESVSARNQPPASAAGETAATKTTAAADPSDGPRNSALGPQEELELGAIRVQDDGVLILCNSTGPTRESSPAFQSQPPATSTKTRRAAMTEGRRNELVRRAKQIVCNSTTNHKLFIHHLEPKHPIEEFDALRPGADIDNTIFKGKAPFWMGTCNGQPEDEVEHLTQSQSGRTSQTERVRKAESLHGQVAKVDGENLYEVLSLKPVYHRRKRSATPISFYNQPARPLRLPTQPIYKLQDDNDEKLLVRSSKWPSKQTSAKTKWYKPKRTSFQLTKGKAANFLDYHHNRLQHPKSRFFVSISNELATSEVSLNQPEPQKKRTNSEISVSEAFTNFTIVRTYKFVEDLETHIQRALEASVRALDSNGERPSDERHQAIVAQRRKWMPTIEELFVGSDISKASGLFHRESWSLLANMTEYFGLFSVAVEQMMFDKTVLSKDKTDLEYLVALEDDLGQIRCEIRNAILKYLPELRILVEKSSAGQAGSSKTLLKQGDTDSLLSNDSINRRLAIYKRSADSSPQTFESPLTRAWTRLNSTEQQEKLKRLGTFSASVRSKRRGPATNVTYTDQVYRPSNFWRDVMPVEQRTLKASERSVRDISILQDMQSFLGAYKTLLRINF